MRKLVLLGGGYGNMRVLLRLLPNNLPLDTEITCKIGDITKGGIDVIARLKN